MIREWSASDLPSVLALLRQLSARIGYAFHDDISVLESRFRAISMDRESYRTFVYESEGRVLGFISLVFYLSVLHHKGTVLINELVVDESARGKGIGGELMRHASELAEKDGWDEIEVGVESFNEEAIRFYKRAGLDEEYTLLGREFIE